MVSQTDYFQMAPSRTLTKITTQISGKPMWAPQWITQSQADPHNPTESSFLCSADATIISRPQIEQSVEINHLGDNTATQV